MIDKDLINAFEIYLKFRKQIVALYGNSEFLFIKCDGNSYLYKTAKGKDNSENRDFYYIMFELFGHQSVKVLYYYRILQMLNANLDITSIMKLTGIGGDSIFELIKLESKDYESDEITGNILNYFSGQPIKKLEHPLKKIGHIICSYCGKEFSATSDKWMLVQFNDMSEKFIACNDCEAVKNGQKEWLY